MAKKKIDIPEDTMIKETPEVNEEAGKVPAETITETTVKLEELPDHVKKVFKMYPDVEAFYIDTKGGVYSADTKPCMVGSAILYKNPNYKS